MRDRILMICGMLAPAVYVVTVIVGGLLRPGYSQLSQYVSELIEAGAPNKALLDPLFAVYNVLTLLFGLGLFRVVRLTPAGRGKAEGTLGALFLIAEGVFGLLTVFFPQDPIGAPVTSSGTMHILLASLSSLTTMLAMLFTGLWFLNAVGLRRDAVYSFASLAVVFISGGMAASTISHPLPFSGLLERITIGGFLQWMFVIALRLFRRLPRL